MPQRQRLQLLCVVNRQDVPLAIPVVIFRQLAVSLPCKISTVCSRHDINLSASANDSLVQFYVLIPDKPNIIPPIFVEHISSPTSERHSVNLLFLVYPSPECGIANTELVAQDFADSKCLGRFVQDIRFADATNIIGSKSSKRTNKF